MTEPLISIIVPIYNRFNFLYLTLQSLLKQTYKNFEVLCVNDGGESAESIINSLNDPRFKYFEHSENKGLPAARNTGLRHITGEYISLLDSDDIYMPLALEFRMWNMKKLNANIVYTRALQNIFEKKLDDDNNEYYQVIHQQLYWNCDFDRDLILVQNIAPCNCVLFSRKAWENTEYWYDEELKSGEDYDMWIALSRKYYFHDLRLIDCEDSYRTDLTQMSGSRKFEDDLPRIFKRWRNTARNLDWVINSQNAILHSRNLNPADFGL